jgi:undecaprenyl phosphate-alpha-L-ara4N flippase subunit ArnF
MMLLESYHVAEINLSLLQLVIENQPVVSWLVAGLACYGLSMLSWMFALTKYELSFAYPFLGITYILVYLGAVFWPLIGEQLSWQRSTGIALILTGVVFVNYNNSNDKHRAI